jgi:hypothetical protein
MYMRCSANYALRGCDDAGDKCITFAVLQLMYCWGCTVVPEPGKDCNESSANAATSPCRLWTHFVNSQESCSAGDQWCQRNANITILVAKDTQDHYLIMPNAPNTGLENWQKLGGAAPCPPRFCGCGVVNLARRGGDLTEL